MKQLVVLASGNGTNAQAIMDACAEGRIKAEVAAVVTNRAAIGVLDRAASAGIAADIVAPVDAEERADYDSRLTERVKDFRPDLVVLAGWDRILTAGFCKTFRIVNLHPAKPGTITGLGAIEKAYDAWQRGELRESGVTVHWVPDAQVDAGPVIEWKAVAFHENDTLEAFAQRMHETEHKVIVSAVSAALDQITIVAR
jgi:phosphoribosylglycinamide formyltransferase-1